jgi:hypothetical protein
MKLILSRKGFDTEAGGHPSPVLPDGRIVSIPIPGPPGPLYSELRLGAGTTYEDLLLELGISLVNGIPTRDARAHADPDLDPIRTTRTDGWLPVFGQADAAQAHLRNQGIGPGDLFLFFGLFRRAERVRGRLRFTGDPFHMIWGYLEISHVLDVGSAESFAPWLRDHVHVASRTEVAWRNNTVYVASANLSRRSLLPGGGTFTVHRPDLQLTTPGANTASWRLPMAFHPTQTSRPMTYHAAAARWKLDPPYALLSSAARGQEFVVEVNNGISKWLTGLFDADL